MLPAPKLTTICALGTSERVVDTMPIHTRMQNWRHGKTDLYPGAEHEIMMETAVMRQRLFDSVAAHFSANR